MIRGVEMKRKETKLPAEFFAHLAVTVLPFRQACKSRFFCDILALE
jgi:hypothetical protein